MGDKEVQTDAVAGLIEAIGTAAFADRFLAAMQDAIDVDLCSAFAADSEGRLRLLLTAGEHPHIPGFAVQASLDYAQIHWRSDVEGRRLRGRKHRRQPLIVRQSASEIADPAYRHACYERGGIGERVTIHAPHGAVLFANGYRMAGKGPASPSEMDRLERLGPTLLAAAATHDRIRAGHSGSAPDEHEIVRLLMQHTLSAREAEVCAGLIAGRTHSEIGEAMALSATTIITYRRRAYGKLGVGDRRSLVRLHQAMREDTLRA
jgi:DNA-binding CsgD family transcriptional regulator